MGSSLSVHLRDHVCVITSSPGKNGDVPVSLVTMIPHSGRRHQLRVTSSTLGHAILGDLCYGEARVRHPTEAEEQALIIHADAYRL